MPRAGFEPKNPAFERAKRVHALDRAATAIGISNNMFDKYVYPNLKYCLKLLLFLLISKVRPSMKKHGTIYVV
jgi:hypothetical protein